jgi:hypothetical protein
VTPILAAQVETDGSNTVRFAVFLACTVTAGVGGYLLKRAGLAKPRWARRTMSAAIVGCDAPIAWLAVWHLAIDPDVWKVPVAGGIAAMATSLAGLWVATRLRLPPRERALVGLQGGMGNVGYTLGGAICFAVWGIQGLALEQMFCMMWPFFAFLFCFPTARHYGQVATATMPAESPSAARYALGVLARSLTDLRSLPLYTVTLGLALNLRGVAPPAWIERSHVIDALMVAGIFLQFGGVGLTVEVRRLPRYWKMAVGTAGFKFLVQPALMLAAATALGLAGVPLYVCLVLAAMPTALYSVLMANLFGLNRDLANATFLLTHAVCLSVVGLVLLVWSVAPGVLG